MTNSQRGTILNLQRFSIHDGPGIRTLIFMKGCPLRCLWCSNPESQKSKKQLGLISSRCVGCGKCIDRCPNGAIGVAEDGRVATDRSICVSCGQCVEACVYEAREIAGREVTISYLIDEVEKDRDFYANSGGGVTVGGGEPLYQHGFVREFLQQCHERWLHTALETCGYGPWEHLQDILEHVDYLYYDVKHMDPVVHKRLTGVSNKLILSNLKKVISEKKHLEVIIRVPIIPGVNDLYANIAVMARFISELGSVKEIELLPYHRLGISKYQQFGMGYRLTDVSVPDSDQMKRLERVLRALGLNTYCL